MNDCSFFAQGKLVHKHRLSFLPMEGNEVWIVGKIYIVTNVALDLRATDNTKINVFLKELVYA